MTTTHHVPGHADAGHGFFSQIVHGFTVLGQSITGAIAASREYERLSLMSDSELAAHGLTRSDIPRRVLDKLGA